MQLNITRKRCEVFATLKEYIVKVLLTAFCAGKTCHVEDLVQRCARFLHWANPSTTGSTVAYRNKKICLSAPFELSVYE